MSDVDRILNFDGLWEAEKLTGNSYKEDSDTSSIGFMLTMLNNERKKSILKDNKDTYCSMPPQYLIELLELHGYSKVIEEYHTEDKKTDYFYVFVNFSNGTLVKFDTYFGNASVNGGNCYYLINCTDHKSLCNVFSIGSTSPCEEYEFARYGNFDIREGFLHKLNKLSSNGEFIKDFPERYTTHLCPWWIKYKDNDSNAITIDYIRKLPEPFCNNFTSYSF